MDPHIAAFAAGAVVFFGAHVFSALRPRGASDIKLRMGVGAYMGLYSLASLAGLVLLIWGYGGWRNTVAVWDPPTWTRHISLTLMLPALILLVAAYAPAGWIKKVVKHPMLTAIKIWAVSHLLANGDLASILLFGLFLAYAVFDRIAVKRRGDPVVDRPSIVGDLISVGIGAGVYVGFVFWAHPVLIGVPVLP